MSDKSPKGKGLAMARAIEEEETAASFPAGIIYECIFKSMSPYAPEHALIVRGEGRGREGGGVSRSEEETAASFPAGIISYYNII